MHAGSMAAWLLLVALLQVAPVSSASVGSKASSAVLSAAGSGYLLDPVVPDEAGEIPECMYPCDGYEGDVHSLSESVCMYLDKVGGGDRICRHKDIGGDCATQGNICKQTLDDLCPYQCTEWSGIFEGFDHGKDSPNVCQSTVAGEEHKCRGKKQAGAPLECDENIKKNEVRCRQQPVLDCWLFCEGWKEAYGGPSADQNSELVCQNLDAGHRDFGTCYPESSYLCDANSQKSHDLAIKAGVGSKGSGPAVCKQVVHKCVNPCAAGSTWTEPTGTTLETISVCQDSALLCSKGACDSKKPRCRPTTVHQNTGNVDLPGQDWPVAPHLNQDAIKFEAHHTAAVGKVLVEQQGKAVMRRDGAEEVKGQ